MNKYDTRSMVIPRTTKVAFTVFMINFVDILIVFSFVLVGGKLSSAIATNIFLKILIVFSFVVLGVFFASKSTKNEGVRNIKALSWVLMQDRNKYYPLVLEETKKGLNTNVRTRY